MIKKINAMIGVMVLLCSILIFPLKSLAVEIPLTGNQASDATVITNSGENVTNDHNLDRYKHYKVSYHWTIAPNTKVNDGDTASFTLPDNIQVLNDTTFDVTLDDGTVIGQFTIKAGEKTGTLTFNDYLSQHPMNDISGNLSFWGNGTANQSTETAEINKVGWVNQEGKPTWSVLYNPSGEQRDNVVIEDTLEGKQTLDASSIKIEYGTMQDGQFVADETKPEGTVLNTNEDGFKLTIPHLNKVVRITYTSTPENTQFDLNNKVQATSDQLQMVQNTASITVGGTGDATGTTESTETTTSSTESSSESTETTTSSTESSSESTDTTTSSTESSSESTDTTTSSTESSSESTETTTSSTESSSESTETTTSSTESSSESTETTTSSTESSSESTETTTSSTESSSESTETTTSGTESSSENTETTTSGTESSNENTDTTSRDEQRKQKPVVVMTDNDSNQHPTSGGKVVVSEQSLPQTGNHKNKRFMMVGSIIVIFVIITIIVLYYRHRK